MAPLPKAVNEILRSCIFEIVLYILWHFVTTPVLEELLTVSSTYIKSF